MKINKALAVRAKEIAESKIAEEDYRGAMEFTLKAKKLYPELEGLSQMLDVLNVYMAAERRINGHFDLYAVLGSHPWAGSARFRKAYLQMVRRVHPDKNKCVGATGAFVLLTKAYAVLKDDASRIAYNTKLNPMDPDSDYIFPKVTNELLNHAEA